VIDRLLAYAGLALGLVNGVFLLRHYVRDRPSLRVEPIHPDTYQWWLRLPPGEYQGQQTRRYGFLPYIDVTNRGLRRVSLSSWRLCVRTRGLRRIELKPMNITEPIWQGERITKVFPVLGQKSPLYSGSTVVESGCGVSGVSYYVYECYGGQGWDPRIKGDRIHADVVVTDVFGGVSRTRFSFALKDLAFVEKFIEGITEIHRDKAGDPAGSGDAAT